MADRHGIAQWPGVRGFITCSYTAGHGITPGVAQLVVPEQDPGKIPYLGDLVITDGNGKVRLRRAKMVNWEFTGGAGTPRTLTLYIADRRWTWRYGAAYGNWNQIDPYPDAPVLTANPEYIPPQGPWMPGTYRPAHEMMRDLLILMREDHPLIEDPPTVPVPARWAGEPPAEHLQRLCDQLGYRIVYQPIADRILVVPLGQGATLPNVIPIVSASVSVPNMPGLPSRLECHGDDVVWNDYLRLQACAPEYNGTIKELGDLSYAPSAGWGTSPPPFFSGVRAGTGMTQEESTAYAMEHVWRTYRVMLDDVTNPYVVLAPRPVEPLKIPGVPDPITDRRQITLLPKCYGLSKDERGQLESTPPFAVGVVSMSGWPNRPGQNGAAASMGATRLGPKLPVKLTIDSARGLVVFDRYMVRRFTDDTDGKVKVFHPDLYLKTSFKARRLTGLNPYRFIVGGPTGAITDPLVPPLVISRPEMVQVINIQRSISGANVANFTLASPPFSDNLDDLLPQANHYLRSAMHQFGLSGAGTHTYNGVVGLDPDGAVQQVTWQVGGGPAVTTASRNVEHAWHLAPYNERRRIEDVTQWAGFLKKVEQKKSGPRGSPDE